MEEKKIKQTPIVEDVPVEEIVMKQETEKTTVKETAPVKTEPVTPAPATPKVENQVDKIIKQLEKLPRKSINRKQYTAIQKLIQNKIGAK